MEISYNKQLSSQSSQQPATVAGKGLPQQGVEEPSVSVKAPLRCRSSKNRPRQGDL